MLVVMNGRKVEKLGGQDRRWLTVVSILVRKTNAKAMINKSYHQLALASGLNANTDYIVVNDLKFKYIGYFVQWLMIGYHGISERHIHFAGNALEMTPAALFLKMLGKKISFSFNGVSTVYLKQQRQWKSYVLLKIMGWLSDRVEILNKTVVSESFFKPAKILLSNAMYSGEIPEISIKTPKTIVFAGHLYALKGIEILLEIVSTNPGGAYSFYIFGDLPDSASMEEARVVNQIKKTKKVHFMGHKHDMRLAFSEAVVTLSLQTISNYPSQVVMEALSSGCAVVITDTGDSRRFGEGPGLHYVPSKFDSDKYWSAIYEAELSSLNDPHSIASFAREEYSADAYVDNLIEKLGL